MDLPTDRRKGRLPRRFPVGTKYVVEGYGSEGVALRVIARYVVLPGGRRINVPADPAIPTPARVLSFRRRANSKRLQAKGRLPRTGKNSPPGAEPADAVSVDWSAPGEAPSPSPSIPALSPGRVGGRGSSISGHAQNPGSAASFGLDDQIVTMDHFRPPAETQNRCNIGR